MGLSLVPVVREYRDLLRRTQVRHGRLQPSLELTYQELESYLAQKKSTVALFNVLLKLLSRPALSRLGR